MTQNNHFSLPQEEIRKRGLIVWAVTLAVILADQIFKIWVKTHFYLGEDLEILSWWHLKFIENNGMAFGMELGSKLLLTGGRICAVILFLWYICHILQKCSIRYGFLITCALITAGAAGNIFDCVFYGEIFNNPMPPAIAEAFPPEGGYAGWFEGRVVDMLYFPIFDFIWPAWVPGLGGEEFEFFQYIFNIADASICVGVFLLILFYSNDFSESLTYLKEKRRNRRTEKEPK